MNRIARLLEEKGRIVVAIDGNSAAGKSSLATHLKEIYSCNNVSPNVISMDYFFLRPEQRTAERLAQPGGNIDYERFVEEVIGPLKSGEPFVYRPYDCRTMELTEPISVDPKPLTVVEGVYSMHPDFDGAYDICVFLRLGEAEQLRRLKERNPLLLERFISEWIPMESKYFEHFRIPEKCDFVFEDIGDKSSILSKLRGGLVVSCQALPGEPLHDPYIMRCMAQAAAEGGAVALRANSVVDIEEIIKYVKLPVIGLIKKEYPDSDVYITPTRSEVDSLVSSGARIIAMDATLRKRPGGVRLEDMFPAAKAAYPDTLFMADCATFEEGQRAETLGFDLIGTTLCGYTSETRDVVLPDFALMRRLVDELCTPIVAEGGIWSPEQMREAFLQGVHCCVVGTAITRPQEIVKRYVSQIPKM
jgi:N-acylglucosamine-6-phosphate 2-epimerase